MTKFLKLLLFSSLISNLALSSCSAPKPHKVSFSGKLKPVNFGCQDIDNSGLVIKSEQVLNHYNKRFVYLVDEDALHSPEFLYYIIHADKIIARIRPPFTEFMYEQTIESLRNIGVTANIELIIDECNSDSHDDTKDNDAQVTLECIKYKE